MGTATGEVIRELRQAAGLGRRDLAKAADISQVFLSKLEQGERRPSPQTLTRIARALGLSIGELAAKIAVFEATAEPSKDDMQRKLLRAAAIGGGAAVMRAIPLGPGLVALGAAALAARRKHESARRTGDESSNNTEELRKQLILQIKEMSADQLIVLSALLEEALHSKSTE